MSNSMEDIAIALAGICQNAHLVTELSQKGECSIPAYNIAIKSIFNRNAHSTLDVYGSVFDVKQGLDLLIQILSPNQKKHMDTMRYCFDSMVIANKLNKNKEVLNKIGERLTRIQTFYSDLTDDIIAENSSEISYSLAGIYSDLISPVSKKIRVTGHINILQNTLVQAKIRTCLFAAIRSSILWQQVGGSRAQLFFNRKKVLSAALTVQNRLRYS